MANEHSIRVSARGEFGQLQRGLKSLQGDLKSVLGEIDRGARKGGIFDDTQLRALDVYRKRFKDSLADIDKEFKKQNDAIDRLHGKMQTASRSERENLKNEINAREKKLDVLRRETAEIEKLYSRRNREADNYDTASPSEGGEKKTDRFGSMMTSRLPGMGGATGWLAGLLGIGGVFAMGSQAYNLAYQSRVQPLDLAQRIRGKSGWNGDAYNMWNGAYAAGTKDKMGYSTDETWGFMDGYSRQAGAIGSKETSGLLKFGRAFGLSTNELEGIGGIRAEGGAKSGMDYAKMLGASVQSSGMTPRILEVLQTSKGLLAQLNTSLKDTGAKQILAYQTTLDKIGTEKGMMKLTGAQGANIIGGLGGIFGTGNDDWKWMGVQALQKYNPKKYGKMGLFDLESSFEDGLMNPDNLPAMAGYLKSKSGGNTNTMKRMLQQWLQAGGYNATKTQVSQLYSATDGLNAFGKKNMDKVDGILDKGDGGQKSYQTRMQELGQNILDINARFEKQLEELGQPILSAVTHMKGDMTGMLEWATNNKDVMGVLNSIFGFLQEHWKSLATIAAIGTLGSIFFKGFGLMSTAISILSNPIALTALAVIGLPLALSKIIKGDQTKHKKEVLAAYKKAGVDIPKDASMSDLDSGAVMDKRIKAGGIHNLPAGKRAILKDAEDHSKPLDKKQTDQMQNYLKGLKDSGDVNLSDLFDTGNTNFSALFDAGNTNFEDLNKQGQSYLDALYKDGSKSLSKMYSSNDTTMSQILNTHLDIKSMFSDIWNDISTTIKSLVGGDDGTKKDDTSPSGGGGGYDVRKSSGISTAKLQSKLGGKLKPYAKEFMEAGYDYSIDPAVLAAIAMHETGNGTSNAVKNKNNVGGMMGSHGLMSFPNMHLAIQAFASNLKSNYVDKGLTTVADIQKKYAPVGAKNDPTGLNNNWTKGVSKYLAGFGIDAGTSPAVGDGGGWLNGWKSRITSHFGDVEGRSRPHSGLDIKEKQGTHLGALAGGIIEKILYDDGSKKDKDHKKNTSEGGNTVMVRMADGTRYAYAHLSKINSKLKAGMSIGEGDWIGNSGGAPGVAGSGFGTTGSHLHLGYYDKNGKAMNPEDLLNSRSIGDVNSSDLFGSGNNGNVQTVNINANVKITGDTEKLNHATTSQLRKFVEELLKEREYKNLAMNPSIR